MTAKACRAITCNSRRKTIEFLSFFFLEMRNDNNKGIANGNVKVIIIVYSKNIAVTIGCTWTFAPELS